MSIAVALDELAATLARYGYAYLLTIGDDGRPHVVAVQAELHEGAFRIAGPGRRTSANVLARPEITLLWPPARAGEHSLIVDGSGELVAEILTVTPARAVLHRAAPAPAPTPTASTPAGPTPAGPTPGCAADCVELPVR